MLPCPGKDIQDSNQSCELIMHLVHIAALISVPNSNQRTQTWLLGSGNADRDRVRRVSLRNAECGTGQALLKKVVMVFEHVAFPQFQR